MNTTVTWLLTTFSLYFKNIFPKKVGVRVVCNSMIIKRWLVSRWVYLFYVMMLNVPKNICSPIKPLVSKSFPKITRGYHWCVLCRRIKLSCVNHRPNFRHLTRNPFKKPIDFNMMEPEMLKYYLVSGFLAYKNKPHSIECCIKAMLINMLLLFNQKSTS